MNLSCIQIVFHTLIVLTTTYMTIMFCCLYIHEGQDTKTVMCIFNLPWRCNGGYHMCCLKLGVENEVVGGGREGGVRTLLPSFSCIEHPRRLRFKGEELNDLQQ